MKYILNGDVVALVHILKNSMSRYSVEDTSHTYALTLFVSCHDL